jgi:NADH dehydrogenase (ubiquinone) Fe-S protein 4
MFSIFRRSISKGAVGVLSGAPEEQLARTVRIYVPCRTAEQQGLAKTKKWKLDFLNQQKWSNPLMGWTSSADPLSSMNLQFDSKDAAIAFAEKSGYAYIVEEPHVKTPKVRAYADNFSFKAPKPEDEF